MESYEDHAAASKEGQVLVVDDVATTRAIHTLILARYFEVRNAESGAEALELCRERVPDLVLLDVDMPGLNGFETCRRLRETLDIPIIFITAYESPEEHLKAFDAGGTDLCVKPVSAEILLHKVRLAISQWRECEALKTEKASLEAMSEQYQSSMSERRLLLQFTRDSLNCSTYAQLAANFLRASQQIGVQCCVAIRHDGEESAWSQAGAASALERAVLTQIAGMGNLVQFKNRLGLNHGLLSAVVSNMPDERSDDAARIRESMSLLVEMAAALAERIAPQPVVSAKPGEEMPADRRKMLADARLLVQELFDRLERSFDLMSTDKVQEERITEAVRAPMDRLLAMLDEHWG